MDKVVGSNIDLVITKGSPLSSREISITGSNIERMMSVGKSQNVELRIIGSNNDIRIDPSIFNNVLVVETGSNNKVYQN